MNKKLTCPTEAQECKALIKWAAFHPIAKYILHIPNGGSRGGKITTYDKWGNKKTVSLEAKNLKAQGVKEGVFDYLLPYPHKGRAGMWLEMKRRLKSLSRLSEEQAQFGALMERLGYHTAVAYGWEDGVKKIEEYLK